MNHSVPSSRPTDDVRIAEKNICVLDYASKFQMSRAQDIKNVSRLAQAFVRRSTVACLLVIVRSTYIVSTSSKQTISLTAHSTLDANHHGPCRTHTGTVQGAALRACIILCSPPASFVDKAGEVTNSNAYVVGPKALLEAEVVGGPERKVCAADA
jgi:hypothetical protein